MIILAVFDVDAVVVVVVIISFIFTLEMRSVERDICPIAMSIMNELFHGRMHCACAKRPYFQFRSKI